MTMKLNSLESISTIIAFDSRDGGEDSRLAWIYGIIFGWGDATEEIQAKFNWNDHQVEQLKQFREDFQQRMEIEIEERRLNINAPQTGI